MSVSGEHLSQERLSEKAMAVLEKLGALLGSLDFKSERDNLLYCTSQAALFTLVQELIEGLQFITIKDLVPGYNVFRIIADKSNMAVPILISTSPAYLIPVRITEGTPMVSSKPFERGTATLIRSPFKVSPALAQLRQNWWKHQAGCFRWQTINFGVARPIVFGASLSSFLCS